MAQTRFSFCGTASIPKEGAKRPFVRTFNKDGREMRSINFGVRDSATNMGFVEAFDSQRDKIVSFKKDGDKVEIKWADRFDEEIISEISDMRKYTVDLGEELGGRHEFLTMFDAIECLSKLLPLYNGRVCVTGQMSKSWYKDRYIDRFNISNVYAVADDERPSRLLITSDIYYNKECVDKTDWKESKEIAIDGYVEQYINKEEGVKFIPHRFVFNATKYKEDNEHHMKLLNYKMKYVDTKAKKMSHLLWECVLINGAEEVEFDESHLTAAQREQIELGIRTLEDFKPKGNFLGERKICYRLFEPKLLGDFSEGCVECDMTNSEFEDMVYVPAREEKLEEVMKKASKEEVPFKEDEITDDDLF